jgi:hypothetical protein
MATDGNVTHPNDSRRVQQKVGVRCVSPHVEMVVFKRELFAQGLVDVANAAQSVHLLLRQNPAMMW